MLTPRSRSLFVFFLPTTAVVIGLAASRVQADLLVSSPNTNGVKRYSETTGAFLGDFVPSGGGGLMNTHGLAVGPDGNLYVSSPQNNSVKRYDGTTGTFLGDFVPSGSGGLTNNIGLIFGPDDNLYVTSTLLTDSIKRYDGSTGA